MKLLGIERCSVFVLLWFMVSCGSSADSELGTTYADIKTDADGLISARNNDDPTDRPNSEDEWFGQGIGTSSSNDGELASVEPDSSPGEDSTHRTLTLSPEARWSRADSLAALAMAKKNQDFGDAARDYEIAINELEGSARLAAVNNYVSLLLLDHDVEKAEKLLKDNIREADETLRSQAYSKFLFNYGRVLEETGQYQDALHQYEKAYRTNPNLASAGQATVAMLLADDRSVSESIEYGSSWINKLEYEIYGKEKEHLMKPLLLDNRWRKNEKFPQLVEELFKYMISADTTPDQFANDFEYLISDLPTYNEELADDIKGIFSGDIGYILNKNEAKESLKFVSNLILFDDKLDARRISRWIQRLGDYYVEKQNLAAGAQRYALSWSTAPEEFEPAIYLANLLLSKEGSKVRLEKDLIDRFDNAIRNQQITAHMEMPERYARLNFLMGKIQEEEAAYESALYYYEESLRAHEVDPTQNEEGYAGGALVKIGDVKTRLGEVDEAMVSYRTAAEGAIEDGDLETASNIFEKVELIEMAQVGPDEQKFLHVFYHQSGIRKAAFSPDGGLVVTTSNDRTSRIWNTAHGTIIAELRGHQSSVRDAEFDPAGKLVATASNDGSVMIWNPISGAPIQTLRPPEGAEEYKFKSVSFNPTDPTTLAAATDTGSTMVWNIQTGEVLDELNVHGDSVRDAAFDSQGDLVSASWDGTVRRWNSKSREVETLLKLSNEQIAGLQEWIKRSSKGDSTAKIGVDDTDVNEVYFGPYLSPRLNMFAVVGPPAIVDEAPTQFVYLETADKLQGRRLTMPSRIGVEFEADKAEENVVWVDFSADESQVVTAFDTGVATIWDADNGENIGSVRHREALKSAQFSPNSEFLVTTSVDGSARLWSMTEIAE